MAVQLALHLPPRRMLLCYVSTFFVASVLSAWAPDAGVFIGAFITEGLCTSLMLIAAVPPLVTGWPPEKMPWTGSVMNLCIFGAVAIGPTVGGLQESTGSWRPLFWAVAGVGGLALLSSLLTYEDSPPADKSAPFDLVAIALAACGCGAAFFGAGLLEADHRPTAGSVVPLAAGIAMVVALVVYEYRLKRPLMPVRQLATTLPVCGILIAMCASSAAVGLMELIFVALGKRTPPGHLALLFLPEFAAAAITAAIFGALFRSRFTPLLALFGMAMLSVGAALLTGIATGGDAAVAAGAGLIGLGVGSSVSPALFIAGFSLRSGQIQRVFALIELLRGVAAFLVAPILVYLATVLAGSRAGGLRGAVLICLGISAAGGVAALVLFLLGGGRLQDPDLVKWQECGEPAWESPPLFSTLRGGTGAEQAPEKDEDDRQAKAS
jgi:hypothetical protein